MPAKPPSERGQGRNGKDKSSAPDMLDLGRATKTAYRKLATNKDKLDEYFDTVDDVPTQGGFIKWTKNTHVANNSCNNEWYTPEKFIEAARKAMGSIDLDPATSQVAQKTVQAETFYTIDDNGLSKQWSGNVWLNPPYAKNDIESFSEKVCEKEFKQAIVLVNNATETGWFQNMAELADAFCFPKSRIKYNDSSGKPANSPLQGQAFLYFGSRSKSFLKVFGEFGICLGGAE